MGRKVMMIFGLGLAVATGLVVVLARRLRSLSEAYVEIQRLSTALHTGSVVPTFWTATLGGDSITVGEAADTASRQLLFFFTTTCPYCKATLPVWAEVADSAAKLGPGLVQVVAISLDSAAATRAYVAEHRLQYPVVLFPDWRMTRLYRAGRVPTTVVLNGEGTVLYARVGLLRERMVRDSIYQVLGPGSLRSVRLPIGRGAPVPGK